ncbi:MAG: T9SS type A sorting domain-containing protein [Nitrososphaerota archaeon]|nr:T9SS type A sorting domain-containing protein [Nitrososphaerota archaeon]
MKNSFLIFLTVFCTWIYVGVGSAQSLRTKHLWAPLTLKSFRLGHDGTNGHSLRATDEPFWQQLPIQAGASAIFMARNDHLYAANSSGNNGATIYASKDHGMSWASINFPDIPWGGNTATPTVLFADRKGNIFLGLAGDGYGLFRSTDGGSSWTKVLTVDGLGGLSEDKSGNLFSADAGPWNGTGAIYKSTDSGVTWNPVLENDYFSDIIVRADGNLLASADGGIYESSDDGLNWGQVLTGIKVQTLAENSKGVVFAGSFWSPGGMFRSTDSCRTWNETDSGFTYIPAITSISILPNDDICVGTNNGLGVWRSTDGGTTWNDFNAGLPNGYNWVFAADTLGYIFVANGSGLYRGLDASISVSIGYPFVDRSTDQNEHWFFDTMFGPAEFLFKVRLDCNPDSLPMKNIAITGTIGADTLIFYQGNSSFKNSQVSTIPQIPSTTFNDIKTLPYIELLASSKSYTSNQLNRPLNITITSINGNPVNISYSDTASLYIVKNGAGDAFNPDSDEYSFNNTGTRLTFLQTLGYLVPYNLIGFGADIFNLSSLSDGRCFGFSSTCGSYFLYPELKPHTSSVSSWNPPDQPVIDNINSAHISQSMFVPYLSSDYTTNLSLLMSDLEAGHPTLLAIYGKPGGHAILATKMEVLNSSSDIYLDVYDPNNNHEPCAASLNSRQKTFSYVDWQYSTVSWDTFKVVGQNAFITRAFYFAISNYLRDRATALATNGSKSFAVACPVNLLISNSKGQRIGYLQDGTFVNEIPSSSVQRIATLDALNDSLTIINVPSNDQYKATMYSTASGNMVFEVTTAVNDSTLHSVSTDTMSISNKSVGTFDDNNPSVVTVDYNGDGKDIVTYNTDTTSIMTALKSVAAVIPSRYSLSQNFPNPFNPTTAILFDLPKAGQVTLKIYDVLGRNVATIVDGYKAAGSHQVTFDATKLASGVYFYRLEAGTYHDVKKLLLLK